MSTCTKNRRHERRREISKKKVVVSGSRKGMKEGDRGLE